MTSDSCISETSELTNPSKGFCLEFWLLGTMTFSLTTEWIFPFLDVSGTHHLYQPYNAPFLDQSTGATVQANTCNSPATNREQTVVHWTLLSCVCSVCEFHRHTWMEYRETAAGLCVVVLGREVQFQESCGVTRRGSAPPVYISVFYWWQCCLQVCADSKCCLWYWV